MTISQKQTSFKCSSVYMLLLKNKQESKTPKQNLFPIQTEREPGQSLVLLQQSYSAELVLSRQQASKHSRPF
jgi:hypothetical protein